MSAADGDLTYGELTERAAALADRLRRIGVGPDVIVGLCAERGSAMIVGALGILQAGGAYLPIDPDYPSRRIELLLRDSGTPVVVATAGAADRLPSDSGAGPLVVRLGEGADGTDPAAGAIAATGAEPGDHNLAYVIYTSGSTGTPKGVLVEHRNLVSLLEQTRGLFDFDDRDVWTVFHSSSFDFSAWEIWGGLLSGGRLVVVPADVARSPERFLQLLQSERVTVLNQTPSAFRALIGLSGGWQRPADLDSLRLVIFGGERLDVKTLEPWIAAYGDERPALVNMYGITETTVHTTIRRMHATDLGEPGVSPIGVPLPEYRIELLGDDGRPVPDGTPGEITVSGSGVARGYLGRPELTAERFVQRDGARWYRSGDRAVRADGEYLYLGRADEQLKVRGFRIEPGEIEALLTGNPHVGRAIVTQEDHRDGDVRLVAYLLPPPGLELTEEASRDAAADLAQTVRDTLPAHAWPSSYRFVTQIPQTAHGKADRAALSSLPFREHAGEREAASAGDRLSPTEQSITEIVATIMQGPPVGPDDELFSHGVTSLAFMRILTSINQTFDTEVTGAELDEATVRQLASCVDDQLTAGAGARQILGK